MKIFHFSVRLTFVLYILAAFITIFETSCTKSGTDPSDAEIVLPDSNLTYVDDINELFILKCASRNGCHSTVDQSGGLDLTDYQSITNHFIDGGSVPLIIFRDGANSPLYRILLSDYLGNPRMPFDGPYLNSNQTEGIKTWINEDAPFSSKK